MAALSLRGALVVAKALETGRAPLVLVEVVVEVGDVAGHGVFHVPVDNDLLLAGHVDVLLLREDSRRVLLQILVSPSIRRSWQGVVG